jgi:shikimate kinase
VPERVFLVGMMGAGKTVVGAEVAAVLGWRCLDIDAQIERAAGMSVPELFSTQGESRFRDLERDAIAFAASGDEAVVVCAGGGAVLDEQTRAVLGSSGTVVWLRAGIDTLVQRVGSGAGRPVLSAAGRAAGGDVADALARLDGERRPLYEEVADVVVGVDGLDVAAVARRVVAGLGR